MEKHFLSKNSIKEFKRKRKNSVHTYRFEEPCIDEDIKPNKRLLTEDDFDNFTDSSNSTTPLVNSKYQEYETSTNGCMSSDDSEYKVKYEPSEYQSNHKYNNGLTNHIKTENINNYSNQGSSKIDDIYSNYDDYAISGEQDTFRVDMSRYQYFNISTSNSNSFLNNDFKCSIDLPVCKVQQSSTPPRLQHSRKNRSHIYKPHRHNKSYPVSFVPCKGPACTSQICCAHFCSQKCYDNQKWPIGSTGNFKTSIPDYDSCGQQEINVTDYGLPYPDHTYCRDHKDIYFTADSNIDNPPFFKLVESLFYDEKEMRIKNPVPIPNCNGDPISSNGYIAHSTKRGRPKRSNVVGLLDQYIFHPSTDVIYTPFVFKESIVDADRKSNMLNIQEPIINAIRQCSNLYKDVRPDIPKEVLYGNHSIESNYTFDESIKRESINDDLPCSSVLDDLFYQVADDFSFK